MAQPMMPGPGGLWVAYRQGVYCSPGPDTPATLVYEHDARVTALAAAPNGWMASGDLAGEILVYAIGERRVITVLRVWEGFVADLCWDLEGEVLASVCVARDQTCATEHWHLPGERQALLLSWEDSTRVCWAPDHHAVVGHDDGHHPVVWCFGSGSQRMPQVHTRSAHDLAWSPDSTRLALAWGNHLEVWEPATGEVWWQHQACGAITGVAWADARTLVTAETPTNLTLSTHSEWLRPWQRGASGMLEAGQALRLGHAPTRGGRHV